MIRLMLRRFFLCSCCILLSGWLVAQTGTVQVDIQRADPTCFDRNDGIFHIKLLAGVFPVTFNWTNTDNGDSGSRAFGDVGEVVTLDGLFWGDYAFVFFEPDGRKTYLSDILRSPPAIEATFSAVGDKCFGEHAGQLTIDTVSGGVPPYQFALNDDPPGNQAFWVHLAPGPYVLTIIDKVGCIKKAGTVLPVGTQFILDIGADTTIFSGDTLRYQLMANQVLDSVVWSPARYATAVGADQALFFPFTTTNFRAYATDVTGCTATDELTVTVHRNRSVYLPNVFAPAGSLLANQTFTVFTGGGTSFVQSLRVFDQAGRLVFEQQGFAPNDPNTGWDGTFQGKRLLPGVFLYQAIVRYTDGRLETFEGDVTLIR